MMKFACFLTGILFYCFAYSQSADHYITTYTINQIFSEEIRTEEVFFDPADTISYTGSLSFCQGNSISLTANNAPANATFQWQKDGVDIAGATGINYVANATGIYSVIVTVAGTSITYTAVNVIVFPKPTPDFTFNNNNTCSGTSIQFNSSISNGTPPYSYTWNFGEGGTSTLQNPAYSYSSLGCGTAIFQVSLTVTDANGCSEVITRSITVLKVPDVQVKDQNNIFSPFSNCSNSPSIANPNYTVSVDNISPSASCITTYSINWGDGNVQNNVSFPLSHTYTQLGSFNLIVSATGINGCINSKTYTVVNQANPAVGISAFGSTTGCAPFGFWFKLNQYQSNSPGTTYIWNFGDGSPNVVWTTPITADSIFHTFTSTSCGQPGNQFTVKVTAKNGCDSTTATVNNIKIFTKPVANFSAPSTACITQSVSFSNASTLAFNAGNCNQTTTFAWNFGDPGSSQNTSSLNSPSHIFSTPGTYTVTLIATGSCGSDTSTRLICIVGTASSSFSLSSDIGCSPLNVSATNTSNTLGMCSVGSFTWTVLFNSSLCAPNTGLWQFAPGSNANSIHPSFIFINPGSYTIKLSVSNSCGTITSTRTVTVKKPPEVSIATIANSCGPVTINPSATVTNCGSDPITYFWTFTGGTPATSTAANPGAISYNSTGTHTISLSVTNECGTTITSRNFTINPVPNVTVPGNQSFCPGQVAGPFNFTATNGANITWSANNTSIGLPGVSGSGNISSFVTANTTSSPITSTINVSGSSNGCTGQSTFTITVNPKPPGPTVVTPVNYCQGDVATSLTATAGSGNTLLWYTVPLNGTGSTTAPTPITSVVGSTNHYVSQVNSLTGCEGPRSLIVVSVKSTPVIGSNSFTNPINCASATGTIILNGLTPNTSYIVNYLKNGAPVTATIIANSIGIITITGLTAGTYDNIVVLLNGCSSNAVGPFVLVDPNPPATPVAASNGPICSGNTLNLTSSTTSTGPIIYNWTGPNGFFSSLQNPIISNVTTAASGTYFVTVKLNGCTSTAASVNVVINPTPPVPTAGSNTPLCSGSTLNLTAPSLSGVIYSWTGPNGFSSSLQNPGIANVTTAASGTYSVSATSTLGNCPSSPGSIGVSIKPTPTISGSSATDPSNCASATGTIVLNGLTPNTFYSVNYNKNGNPVTINLTSNNSGTITIGSLTAGSYSNISVSLNGCPSNIVGPFTLSDPNPPTTPITGSNSPVCSGTTLSLTSNTATPGSIIYSWTGPNGFTSNLQNPVITNSTTAASGTYSVTVMLNGCSSSSTLSVIVNPKPGKPVVVRPVLYCLNANASSLVAIASSGNTLTWFDNPGLNNGTVTPIIPVTSIAGNYNFYVNQTNSFGCVSDTATIPVTVYAALTGNNIGNDQTLCSGNTPASLNPQSAISGGNGAYTYQWQISTDNGLTWADIPGATLATYSPGALSATTKYKRVVNSGPCTNQVSNEVTITIQGTLNNFSIAAAQTICSGTQPALLNGQAPIGGDGSYTYQWQSSSDNINWTDITAGISQDYQPSALTGTTYYRRKVISGSCSAFSPSVVIIVNPNPVLASIPNSVYCNNSPVSSIIFNSTPSNNISYAWNNDNLATGLGASGSGNLPGFTAINNNPNKQPITSNIEVIPTYTANGKSCSGNPGSFTIIILPTITISPIADTIVCTSTNMAPYMPIHDAGSFPGSTVTYSWIVSGSGISLTNNNGLQVPTYNTINNGNTDLTAIITLTPHYSFGGKTCSGTPVSYSVTVKPATPGASAGPDTVLCAATIYLMQASAIPGTTGAWTQIGTNTVTIVNPSSPATEINSLQPANAYQFVWTMTGFASCPSTRDTVSITVTPDLTNPIDTLTQTICNGQSIHVTGQQPAGGNGIYFYQWQSSTDGIAWNNIPGQTGSNLTYFPLQSIFLRRVVSSLPCIKASLPVHIIVQLPITNNTASADQSICINTAASLLQGSSPSGASGTFIYQWQQSTDGGINWTNITTATLQNYDPGILNITTKFRRKVFTNLCTGPQSSNSNIITITVNPDAKALFTSVKDSSCAPFLIDASVIHLQQFTDRNLSYQWYANGNFIGSGTSFPGYTINNSSDSVTIKLVVVSSFGCRDDSLEHEFHTYLEPLPSFTLSDTVGCGPLSVVFTNTTPDAHLFQYIWNFGNGQTSILSQPGSVSFLPNPNHGDTTYTIRLSVISKCDTLVVSGQVRVKSKPKALFTPNSTVGCSPMTIIFNNTSLGLGNNYIWNFGDGSAPVSTGSAGTISHTYFTGIRDTFYIKLIAVNECGTDSLSYAIVVSPNTILLDFALNGNEQSGCSPHTVRFINNSQGGSSFTWNFGDGNIINTTQNIDTIIHTYLTPGIYVASLLATNGCSDTTSTETVIVYPKPQAVFTANTYTACRGDSIHFNNLSDSATSYLWKFGDGQVSSLTHPVHTYSNPGVYNVVLIAYRFNGPGSICTDSVIHQIQIVSNMPGWFTATDTVGYCAPFTVSFSNQNLPSVTAVWDFGDGTTGNGNIVTHTYLQAGIYQVKLTVTVPGGCTYLTARTVKVLGPSGSWTHTTGYLCNNNAASFQVLANNSDSLRFNFGDGTTLTTTNNLIFHNYANAGTYFPTVELKNNTGCQVSLPGLDTIKVDKITAGFTSTLQTYCGYTTVNFSDTSHAFFGKSSVFWNFGDGSFGTGVNVIHNYTVSGTYPVQQIVFGNSGCSDTISRLVTITVNAKPIAAIITDSVICTNIPVLFNSSIQSADPLNILQWTISNGVTSTNASFNYSFIQQGNYTIRLVIGTVNGCYDTVIRNIRVNPSPSVTSSNSQNICRGNSVQLATTGTGVTQYAWSPLQGLSCTTCPAPVASPIITTPYVVQGINSFGCSAYDTVIITVIQPMQLSVSPADSICIGDAADLLASGASSYSWSPGAGLNSTTISNPTASPAITTIYRVVGYDGFNCFTDTAFVLVAVGQYPAVNLGSDLVLATGTQHQLVSAIQNGPIKSWLWTPNTNLSCASCPLPIALIKKDISYSVKVTNNYGCIAMDTINIRAFCEEVQVFIPNAFTPDGDGINDLLMVRGKGMVTVKSFRIFNRWGVVVFEKSNFPPNDPFYGWDGRINGIVGGPDVYVYTAEVMCDNGTTYTYKGNVSILK